VKILGWILFFVFSSAHAQQVIEPAPLSVEDDGARKIIENPNGKPIIRPESKEAVVAPPAAEPLNIPNDEVINPTVPAAKKPASRKNKKVAQKKVVTPPVVAAPIPPIATTPVPPPVNPIDGQLKLGSTPSETPAPAAPSVATEKTPELPDVEVLTFEYNDRPLRNYLQFAFGYINSRYSKVDPNLKNGSTETAFKFVADMTRNYQTGFAVEVLSDTSDKKIPENIRSLQYRIFVDYHKSFYTKRSFKLDWVAGLSLAIGDYGIKRRYRNADGEEVSVVIKDGTIIGLIPAGGVRIYLAGQNSFDFMLEYHQYFGNPQKYVGGFAASPRINFEF
jgi:hypothetical protein